MLNPNVLMYFNVKRGTSPVYSHRYHVWIIVPMKNGVFHDHLISISRCIYLMYLFGYLYVLIWCVCNLHLYFFNPFYLLYNVSWRLNFHHHRQGAQENSWLKKTRLEVRGPQASKKCRFPHPKEPGITLSGS